MMRKRLVSWMTSSILIGSLVVGIPVFGEENTSVLTPEEMLAELEKENDELKSQVEELTKELEELKGEEAKESTPEVPESVANADASVQYSDRATVKLVQEALNSKGYNCGSPDGVAGSKTTEQISAYEAAQGITVNGIITDQLIESLGLTDQLEEQAKIEAEKASYSSDYSYEQLARNPDTYMGEKVKVSGKVLQTGEDSGISYLRLAMNSSYDTIVFVTYDSKDISYRLLENDMVTVYGSAFGVYSYQAVSGATITIPWILATYVELN